MLLLGIKESNNSINSKRGVNKAKPEQDRLYQEAQEALKKLDEAKQGKDLDAKLSDFATKALKSDGWEVNVTPSLKDTSKRGSL